MHPTDIATLKVGPFDVTQLTTAPLRFETSAWLEASQDIIFETLSNHEKWPKLFPWVQDVCIDNTHALIKNGLGARRSCNFGQNMVLEEIIVGWHSPQAYAYAGLDETHPFGMIGHVGVVKCQSEGDKVTRLIWQHYFNHANLAAMLQQLDSTMQAAVDNLVTHFGGHALDNNLKD